MRRRCVRSIDASHFELRSDAPNFHPAASGAGSLRTGYGLRYCRLGSGSRQRERMIGALTVPEVARSG